MFIFMAFIMVLIIFASSFRFAMRKGKFLLAKNTKEFLSFSSDLGSFHVKFNEQTFFANSIKDKKTISLKEIAGIRYIVDDQLAIIDERFSLKNNPDFNDVIHWYTIKLILKDRSEIPLFIAGSFERVNWIWFSELQSKLETRLYASLGLITDVDTHCHGVLEKLTSIFKLAGHELPLV
jgi:hypothetical protein